MPENLSLILACVVTGLSVLALVSLSITIPALLRKQNDELGQIKALLYRQRKEQ